MSASPLIVSEDIQDILCKLIFEDFSVEHLVREFVLKEADETFRTFYKMMEDILTPKEESEERTRQASEVVVD